VGVVVINIVLPPSWDARRAWRGRDDTFCMKRGEIESHWRRARGCLW
jgi:hypothetical protein